MRDVMLITHFLGLALTTGYSLSLFFLYLKSSKLSNDPNKFKLDVLGMNIMGHIGIGLMILSGGYLMTPYWKILHTIPFLLTKLSLVVVLAALIGIISAKTKKARNGDLALHIGKIDFLSKLMLAINIIIIILGVLVFH